MLFWPVDSYCQRYMASPTLFLSEGFLASQIASFSGIPLGFETGLSSWKASVLSTTQSRSRDFTSSTCQAFA